MEKINLKKRHTKYFIISIVGVFLGIMLASQYRMVQENYLSGLIPSTKLNQMKSELLLLRDEKEILTNTVNELQANIDNLLLLEADDNVVIASLNEELVKYKMFAGFTNLQGEGVAVYIDNAPIEEGKGDLDIVKDYTLILFIVNELSAAGAEAISINDERYIAGTEVRGTGEFVVVNGVNLKPPFVIRAIGDKEVLARALEQRFGIIDIIRKRGYSCELNRLNGVRIMRSSEVFDWKYAKPKKENE